MGNRIFYLFTRYGLVGVSTYAVDLVIVFVLQTYTPLSLPASLFIGFIIGISTNYTICYYRVFRGTTRTFRSGFVIFLCLALTAGGLISWLTPLLQTHYDLPLVLARTLVGAVVGSINFLLNTIYNFKFWKVISGVTKQK